MESFGSIDFSHITAGNLLATLFQLLTFGTALLAWLQGRRNAAKAVANGEKIDATTKAVVANTAAAVVVGKNVDGYLSKLASVKDDLHDQVKTLQGELDKK